MSGRQSFQGKGKGRKGKIEVLWGKPIKSRKSTCEQKKGNPKGEKTKKAMPQSPLSF
jgi:hypothetical protein